MADNPNHPSDHTASAAALGENIGLVNDVAKSFRRLRGREEADPRGLRTIWHRGKLRSEMLSWEDEDGQVVKQELCMFGIVVEFSREHGLRTGKLPEDDTKTAPGSSASQLVAIDDRLSRRALDYGYHLLRNAPRRDFYMQHMLKHIAEGLGRLDNDDSRTVVANVAKFSRTARGGSEATTVLGHAGGLGRRRGMKRKLLIATIAIAGITLGVVLGTTLM